MEEISSINAGSICQIVLPRDGAKTNEPSLPLYEIKSESSSSINAPSSWR